MVLRLLIRWAPANTTGFHEPARARPRREHADRDIHQGIRHPPTMLGETVASRDGPIDPERLTAVDRTGRFPAPARDAVDSDGRVSGVAESATCKHGGSEGCDRSDRDGIHQAYRASSLSVASNLSQLPTGVRCPPRENKTRNMIEKSIVAFFRFAQRTGSTCAPTGGMPGG
jgi:hypothetical protein